MSKAKDLASGLAGVRPFAMASGIASGSAAGVTVTFPSGRFSVTPNVSTTRTTARGGFQQPESVTSTGFTSYSFDYGGTGLTVSNINWIAIQMTSGAASG